MQYITLSVLTLLLVNAFTLSANAQSMGAGTANAPTQYSTNTTSSYKNSMQAPFQNTNPSQPTSNQLNSNNLRPSAVLPPDQINGQAMPSGAPNITPPTQNTMP